LFLKWAVKTAQLPRLQPTPPSKLKLALTANSNPLLVFTLN